MPGISRRVREYISSSNGAVRGSGWAGVFIAFLTGRCGCRQHGPHTDCPARVKLCRRRTNTGNVPELQAGPARCCLPPRACRHVHDADVYLVCFKGPTGNHGAFTGLPGTRWDHSAYDMHCCRAPEVACRAYSLHFHVRVCDHY